MILTVCPNPSRDCTLELDSLNVGKLNRIRSKTENYGGKGINVAVGASRLKADVFSTGFLFENDAAAFIDKLRQEGVKNDFVKVEGSVRVNYKIIDDKAMLTEINDKGAEVPAQKQQELLEKIASLSSRAEYAVISGSLPKGVDDSFYGEMVEAAKPARVVVDTGRESLLSALDKGVFMVKPNLLELEEFAGEKLRTKTEIFAAAKRLIWKGASLALVSLGAEGAVITDGDKSFYCKSASVAVNSTVGAGDSMVAAAVVALKDGLPLAEVLRRAVAAGTAAITTTGTNLFYPEKAEEIYGRLHVEEI